MIFNHTEETDARIRRGYEDGERIASIAQELGTTRNVIIGRANRIGLGKLGAPRNYPSNRSMPDVVRENSRATLKALWGRGDFRAKLRAGQARYYANRKANHSTALRMEPAE